MPFGQGVGGQIHAQVGSAASLSHDNLVNCSIAIPRGNGACFELGMGASRSQDWRSMHLGLDALAEWISVRDSILTRWVNFCRCELGSQRIVESGRIWLRFKIWLRNEKCVYGFCLFSQELCQRAT